MTTTKRQYSKEEFAHRGDDIYENAIRPHLKPEDDGKFVAVDIDTGEYEIDPDELAVCERLRARLVPSHGHDLNAVARRDGRSRLERAGQQHDPAKPLPAA